MQRYTFHVISREAEAQSFFEGQDGDQGTGRDPKSNKVQHISGHYPIPCTCPV